MEKWKRGVMEIEPGVILIYQETEKWDTTVNGMLL